jgi:hypothetical protein
LFERCGSSLQVGGTGFFDQRQQCGEVGNEQGNVMIGGRSHGFINGFLKADEALIKLEQFSH